MNVSEGVAYREVEVASRTVLAGNLFDDLALSGLGGYIVELHEGYLVGQQVADTQFYLPVFLGFPGETQVDDITRHLVGVGYAHGLFVARAAEVAAHTGDAFAYAVVEEGGGDTALFVAVRETGVDEVGRLALHGAVFFAVALGKLYKALDEGAVEDEVERGHSHEGEVLAQVYFESVAICAVGIAVGVDEVGTSGHGVGPLDGVVEVFVEEGYRYLFAFGGIPFVPQVEVLYITGTQLGVTLYVRGQVEVVEDRGGYLAELGTVD